MARSAENFANFALQIAKNEQKNEKMMDFQQKLQKMKKNNALDSLPAPFLKSVTSKN